MKNPINENCPISGRPIVADSLAPYRGFVVGFCNPDCRDAFEIPLKAFDRIIDEKSGDLSD